MVLAKISLANLYAPAPSTSRGEATSLAATPKGDFLVYPSGKLVVIRSSSNPLQASVYTEHSCAVTCVAVSPSGEWIASGDERGTVRIWANQPERTLKLETFALGGKVMDIAWSGDSQRLCAVGDGNGSFGKVFTWDSGNTLGVIDSHSKRIISCAFKSSRPFRIATGSDDLSVNWYEGPPFKFKTAHREHTRYPNCVRFSPDGEQLVSVGSDSKVIKYDGQTGDKVAELTCDDPHTGAIFACAWAPDSKQLLTASADKTAKIWHVNLGKPKLTIVMQGVDVGDMQVGCCWQGTTVCSLSLSGRINMIDPSAGKIVSSLMGHNHGITSIALDPASPRFASASFDGVTGVWDAARGTFDVIHGKGHENGVVAIAILPGEILASAALDQRVLFANLATLEWNSAAAVSLDGSARGMCIAGDGAVAVVTEKSLFVVSPGSVRAQIAAGFKATAVAVSPSGAELAVGGENGEIHLFSYSAGKLTRLPGGAKRHQGEVTAMAYSPTGVHLASADGARQLVAWELPSFAPVSTSWTAHKAKITSLGWSPSGRFLVTGGVDSSAVLWSMEQPAENVNLRLAHENGVTAVGFLSDDLLITAGQDACIKTWTLKF